MNSFFQKFDDDPMLKYGLMAIAPQEGIEPIVHAKPDIVIDDERSIIQLTDDLEFHINNFL